MKESDMEGVASHHGPGSCVGGGDAAGEAWTGVRAGQPLSSEITNLWLGVPTAFRCWEGHAGRRARRERGSGPTESKTLCMRGSSMRENRETPAAPSCRRRCVGRSGKASGRNPDVDAAGESDIGVVPANVPNKAGSGGVGEHGGTVNPPCNRKGRDGNPPPTLAGVAGPARLRRHGRKGR